MDYYAITAKLNEPSTDSYGTLGAAGAIVSVMSMSAASGSAANERLAPETGLPQTKRPKSRLSRLFDRHIRKQRYAQTWKEDQHQRGGDSEHPGRFSEGSGGGGAGTGVAEKPAPTKPSAEPKPAAGGEIERDPAATLAEMQETSLGMPRHDMPQITSENTEAFLKQLTDRGIKVSTVKAAVGDLKGTQKELDLKKVASMAKAMKAGKCCGDTPVLASNDGYILDGHHRWAAQRVVDPDVPMTLIQVDMPIEDLLDESYAFDDVQFGAVQDKDPVRQPIVDASKAIASVGGDTQQAVAHYGIDGHGVASMVGAADDMQVQTHAPSFPDSDFAIRSTSDSHSSVREVGTDASGKKFMRNVSFSVNPESQGQGIATQTLAKQVSFAASNGFAYIKAHGDRDDVPPPPAAGYHVWPKLGYDGPLSDGFRQTHGVKAKTVQQLIRSKAGRALWEKNGEGIDLTFDLSKGSKSTKILNKYLRHKSAARTLLQSQKSSQLPAERFRKSTESIREWYERSKQSTPARQSEEPGFSPEELEDLEAFWDKMEAAGFEDDVERHGKRWSRELIRGRCLDLERFQRSRH